jgi:DNA-binding NarL/FixJ family response regulator
VKTLLLIASDPASVRAIRVGLRQAQGFRVVATIDGRTPAGTALLHFAPDVVVVDDMCQRTNSLARLREASQLLPDACTVLVAHALDGSSLEDVLVAGADAVIHTPLPPATFAVLLTEVVEGRLIHVPRRRRPRAPAADAPPTRAVGS